MLKFAFPLSLPFLLFSQIHCNLHPHCPGCGVSHHHSIPTPAPSLSYFDKIYNFYLVESASNGLLTSLKFLMPHMQHSAHFAKHLNSAVYCLKSSYLPTERLSYPQLLLSAISPCLFFHSPPPQFLLCHVSIFILHCFSFHASLHITFPLLFLDLAPVHNYMFVIGGYATTTSSGVSGMMLAHHLLIYFLWSQRISSFCMPFLTDNYGPSTFPAKARLAVRAKRSPASSGVKTLFCQTLDLQSDMHLLSPLLFLYFSPHHWGRQAVNKHSFHWGRRISAPVANFFSVFYKDYK